MTNREIVNLIKSYERGEIDCDQLYNTLDANGVSFDRYCDAMSNDMLWFMMQFCCYFAAFVALAFVVIRVVM
ncbi:hypothetical protein AYO40_01030 [Planctomycetaceae bacterium SCGC AG-212-D15]|nr:hypothetical protein AYO40_01030 [Planctomycetaceae bacterium SCGC AG-212-D15]